MALVGSHQEDVRPMLDVIDKLRQLGLEQESIQLPTIVVIGDQSSGKSSVLESLAGVCLPKGTGIVTRVPLILRLKTCKPGQESVVIEYTPPSGGKVSKECASGHFASVTSGKAIEKEIRDATCVLAGSLKAVVNSPITLTVSGPDLPDLTLVDLPGITRVPVDGQPKNIHQLISQMIRGYIAPQETVILNVLSADVDFSTCESICMSQEVDDKGERTLAVVTKVDRSPTGLKEKILHNSVRVGLGYVLVRNKTDAERSHDAARVVEQEFFTSHPELPTLDESMLGIPALARMLSGIQARRVRQSLPEIRKKIGEILKKREDALAAIPKVIDSSDEALLQAVRILQRRREWMSDLISGNYDQFLEDKEMHFAARVNEMFVKFWEDIQGPAKQMLTEAYFDVCKEAAKESAGVSLSNMLGHGGVYQLVQQEVRKIEGFASKLVESVFDYANKAVFAVSKKAAAGYPKLEQLLCNVGQSSVGVAKETAKEFVGRYLLKERSIVFTESTMYKEWSDTIRTQVTQASVSRNQYGQVVYGQQSIPGLGSIDISVLVNHKGDPAQGLQIDVIAYWQVCLRRMVDSIAMEVRFLLKDALIVKADEDAQTQLHSRDVMGFMDVKPGVRLQQQKLVESIKRLRQSQATIAEL